MMIRTCRTPHTVTIPQADIDRFPASLMATLAEQHQDEAPSVDISPAMLDVAAAIYRDGHLCLAKLGPACPGLEQLERDVIDLFQLPAFPRLLRAPFSAHPLVLRWLARGIIADIEARQALDVRHAVEGTTAFMLGWTADGSAIRACAWCKNHRPFQTQKAAQKAAVDVDDFKDAAGVGLDAELRISDATWRRLQADVRALALERQLTLVGVATVPDPLGHDKLVLLHFHQGAAALKAWREGAGLSVPPGAPAEERERYVMQLLTKLVNCMIVFVSVSCVLSLLPWPPRAAGSAPPPPAGPP
jgi:hypothetical protein